MSRTAYCLLLGSILGTASAAQNYGFDPLAFSIVENYNYPYRLFDPREPGETAPAEGFPLVLFLHGLGEKGTNNTNQVTSHLKHLILTTQGDRITRADGTPFLATPDVSAYRSFLAAPQFPNGWSKAILVDELVERLCVTLPIDRTRIYVTGLSAGGGGTWRCLGETPGRYAAGVPLSGVQRPHLTDEIAADAVPVWAIHGDSDSTVPHGQTRSMVAGLITNGFTPRYTEVPGWNHSGWDNVYNPGMIGLRYSGTYGSQGGIGDPADITTPLYPWLFSQQRELAPPLLPGETVRLDLGNIYNRTNYAQDAEHWNNLFPPLSEAPAHGIHRGQTRTTAGELSRTAVSVSGGFQSAGGTGVPGADRYPIRAQRDAWSIGASSGHSAARELDPGMLTISGLVPGGRYGVSCFASHRDDDGGRGRVARYTLTGAGAGQVRDLEAALNISTTIDFEPEIASPMGTLILSTEISPDAPTTRWAYLGVVEVTALGLTFSDWLAQYSLSGSDAEYSADSDNDGIVQLLEYLLGFDPKVSGGDVGTNAIQPDGSMLFEVPVSSAASEGALTVQVSDDLEGWEPVTARVITLQGGRRVLRAMLPSGSRTMVRVMGSL